MGDRVQNVISFLLVLGLIPFNLVERQHVQQFVDSVPGGRPSVTLGLLLLLVTSAALQLIWRDVRRDDWVDISRGVEQRIVSARDLEARYPLDHPEDLKGLDYLGVFERTLYWMADVINWGTESAAFIEKHWGFPEASQFKLKTVPLVYPLPPDTAINRKDLPTNLKLMVSDRREQFEELQRGIAARVKPR